MIKVEQNQIDYLKNAFDKMQSKEDLLNLLNEAKALLYGPQTHPFDLKQLTWHANPKLGWKRYNVFEIAKKSGAKRSIHAPVNGLKVLQKTLAFILQCVFTPHEAAYGFCRNKSIVDNASVHVGANYVFNIDLKDFFPSIEQARIWKTLQLRPFNLNYNSADVPEHMQWDDFKRDVLKAEGKVKFYTYKKKKGRPFLHTSLGLLYIDKDFNRDIEQKYVLLGTDIKSVKSTNKLYQKSLLLVNKLPNNRRLEIAGMIASICCTEMEVERIGENNDWVRIKKSVLPQGAPTSPVITNIVCQRLDQLLTGLAKRFGLKYTRYADDITFSSSHNVYHQGGDFIKELHRIIENQGFSIKDSKTRLQREGYRQEVTGLIVNKKVNVPKRYVKQLRMWLYYWERYGYERASEYFLKHYIVDKGYVKKDNATMSMVISGRLNYLKMVTGEGRKAYQCLHDRYLKLMDSSDGEFNRADHLSTVINLMFEKGIGNALDHYKIQN